METGTIGNYEITCREYLARVMLGRLSVAVDWPASPGQVVGICELLGYPVTTDRAIAIMNAEEPPPAGSGWSAEHVVEVLSVLMREGGDDA